LELRRSEFLTFLQRFKNEQGQFTFERDTYLYRCRKAEERMEVEENVNLGYTFDGCR